MADVTLAALEAEADRRDRFDSALTLVLRASFEFTQDARHAVAAKEAHAVVAEALELSVVGWPLARRITAAAVSLGAVHIHPRMRSVLRGVKRAGDSEAEALKHARMLKRGGCVEVRAAVRLVGTCPRRDDSRTWEQVLAQEGMPAELGSSRSKSADATRQAINTHFLDKASAWFWEQHRMLVIWRLHSLEGLSIRAIAQRLDIDRNAVYKVIRRMREDMEREGEE